MEVTLSPKVRNLFTSILLTLLSAFLTSMAMPGFLTDIFIWFSLAFLFKALDDQRVLGKVLLSYLFGNIFLAITFFWQLPTLVEELPSVTNNFSSWVGLIAFILEVTIIGAPLYALFGLLYAVLKKFFEGNKLHYALFTASLYTIIEYLRGLGPLGFTGGRLSDALYKETGLLQITSFTGTLGLVFLIVFVNALIYKLHSEKQQNSFLKTIAIIGVFYILNSLIFTFLVPIEGNEKSQKPFKIMALQTNVSQEEKYFNDFNKLADRLLALADSAKESNEKVDLYVFPEAAFIIDVEDVPTLKKKIEDFADNLKIPMLVGYPVIGEKKYNQVRLVKPGEGFTGEFYAKIKLTPFAEILPFPKIFGHFSFLKLIDYYNPGPEFHVFELKKRKFSVEICFESFFPHISRKLVKNGAKFLIVVTNDGWFKQKTALIQHFSESIFRAVENRRYVLQISNTGITGLIDPYGRIIKSLPIKKECFSVFEVYENREVTFYNKYGDWFVILTLMILIFIPCIRRWISR